MVYPSEGITDIDVLGALTNRVSEQVSGGLMEDFVSVDEFIRKLCETYHDPLRGMNWAELGRQARPFIATVTTTSFM